MTARSQQLQIRVTATEKAAIKRRARDAGLDVSAYVLARALPPIDARVATIVHALRDDRNRSFALAEFHDLLAGLAPMEFGAALELVDVRALAPYVQNYVAAMVEQAANAAGVEPPSWTRGIQALDEPHFATPLRSVRLYLLRAAPVAFRRRNIFADAPLGARV
ncbi:MAG: plasmid mobilization protein [Gemmatimonadaceae bacterium]